MSEIYDFLREAHSPLKLDKEKLKILQQNLEIKNIELQVGDFDCILFVEKLGIEVKVYEDGLIVLTKNNKGEIEQDINRLKVYYEEKLSPALSYIFSLGAPIPKELANIKTIYPYFFILDNAERNEIDNLLVHFRQKKYFEIKRDTFEIL